MLSARHLSLCPLPCIYCVAPERGVKEGGGEYELMSCCREEPHTNIVRAGQEGEKDSGKAQNRKPRKARIIEEERRSSEKRDINREKELVRGTVKGLNLAKKK